MITLLSLLFGWVATGVWMTVLALFCNPAHPVWDRMRALSIPAQVPAAALLALFWPYAWQARKGRHR